jgi:hypothetical protein
MSARRPRNSPRLPEDRRAARSRRVRVRRSVCGAAARGLRVPLRPRAAQARRGVPPVHAASARRGLPALPLPHALDVRRPDPPGSRGLGPRQRIQVPSGTALRSTIGRSDQSACEYRTGHAVTLAPIELVEAQYHDRDLLSLDLPRDTRPAAVIRLRLRASAGLLFEEIETDDLALYLRGSGNLPTAPLRADRRPHHRHPRAPHAASPGVDRPPAPILPPPDGIRRRRGAPPGRAPDFPGLPAPPGVFRVPRAVPVPRDLGAPPRVRAVRFTLDRDPLSAR